MTEFNLSEKMFSIEQTESEKEYLYKEDVKEFIRRLKELFDNEQGIIDEIDKLAGDDLK